MPVLEVLNDRLLRHPLATVLGRPLLALEPDPRERGDQVPGRLVVAVTVGLLVGLVLAQSGRLLGVAPERPPLVVGERRGRLLDVLDRRHHAVERPGAVLPGRVVDLVPRLQVVAVAVVLGLLLGYHLRRGRQNGAVLGCVHRGCVRLDRHSFGTVLPCEDSGVAARRDVGQAVESRPADVVGLVHLGRVRRDHERAAGVDRRSLVTLLVARDALLVRRDETHGRLHHVERVRAAVDGDRLDHTVTENAAPEREGDSGHLGIRELLQPLVDGAVPLGPVTTTVDRRIVLDVLRRAVREPEILAVDGLVHQRAGMRAVEVHEQVDPGRRG